MKNLSFILIFLLIIAHSALSLADEEPKLVLDTRGHSAMIKEVIFTPDGKTLISVSKDKTIRLWNAASGALLKTIRGQIGEGDEGKLFAAALSPDGKVLAVGGYPSRWGIRLFDLESGKQIGLLKGHTNVIFALAFSQNGKWLASGSGDNSVRIWDVSDLPGFENLASLATLKGHSDNVYGVAFSPDGKKVVSAGFDDIGILWDWQKQKIIKKLEKHTDNVYCVAYAPNGKYIVTGGFDDKILLWNGNGNFIKEIDELSSNVRTVSFSEDSKKIVAMSKEGAVYSIPSGKEISRLTKHDNTVVASAFYGNQTIATAGGENNDIYLWNANSGTIKTHIVGKGKVNWAIAFGNQLNVAFGISNTPASLINEPLEKSFNFSQMSLSSQTPQESDFRRSQTEYRGKTFEKINNLKLRITNGGVIGNDRGTDGEIKSYAFTKNGNVVVGSWFSLKLYKNDGTFIRKFTGHTGVVWAVSASKDGRILASASKDQTIKLWNIQTGDCLATLFVASDNEWVCWTPEGYFDCSANGSQYFGWHINQGLEKEALYYSAEQFFEPFYRPELVKASIKEVKSATEILAEWDETPFQIAQMKIPPDVRFISPGNHSRLKREAVTIEVEVSDYGSGIDAISLYHNGKIVPDSRRGGGKIVPKRSQSAAQIIRKKYQISLVETETGENNFRLIATSKQGVDSNPAYLNLYLEGVKKEATLWILAIGISAYANSVLDLDYAQSDAAAIASFFDKRKSKSKLHKSVKVIEIYDKEATKEGISSAFRELQQAKSEDVILIYLAGHGDMSGKDWYFVPHDLIYPEDSSRLKDDGISRSELERWITDIPAKKIVVLVDACKSGAMLASRGYEDRKALMRLSRSTGVSMVASTTESQYAYEVPELGHGIFTYAILEGLTKFKADYSGDSNISVGELILYLNNQLPILTEHYRSQAQYPVTGLSDKSMDFPIWRR